MSVRTGAEEMARVRDLRTRRPRGQMTLGLLGCLLTMFAAGWWSAPAHAAFGIASFDGATLQEDPNVSYTQAGGHPFALTTNIAFNVSDNPDFGTIWPEAPVKDVFVDAPPGFVGNTTAVAQCTLDELTRSAECPPASQVGTVTVTHSVCPSPAFCIPLDYPTGLFNMVPPPGVPAQFGAFAAGSIIILEAEVRSGSDYGLTVKARNISEALPVIVTSLTLWGVPADDAHTPLRHCPGAPPTEGGCDAGVPEKAYLTMPTACTGPLTTTLHTDSWFEPGNFVDASFVSHKTAAEGGDPIGVTGCDQVPFDAAFDARPQEMTSPGPSGWTFDLTIDQSDITNPDGIAQGALKQATVTLPAGVRVSPSSAGGLGACSPAQIDLHSSAAPTCPDASKVGTVTIDTPVLADPLHGAIYLATPHDNPSGSLIGLYIVAEGQGVTIKLSGSAALDSSTGQISATFDNNPQQPFSRVHLEFFGGSRAALSNPPRCGTYTTHAELTSWSGKTVPSDSTFTTTHDGKGAPCPAPQFKPDFTAGSLNSTGNVPVGGSFSSFMLHIARSDDDEELAAIQSLDLPDGLLAKIASVTLCDAAKAAAGTCGEESRIGSVTTEAGPGPNPFAVSGRVYLGGPYKGAPFSLSIVVPAVAGPFDLGTIVVRSALDVDPATAKATIRTDPLPTALEGIPLQVRSVTVLVDRPKFFVNPTSCNPKRIGATAVSTAGTVAQLSARFKVVDCAALNLTPKMRLEIGGKGHTRKGASVPFTTTLTQPAGQAGLKAVSVTLPPTLNAHLDVISDACTRAQFDAGKCEGARAGSATAVTPLLKDPLKGGVYFVKDPSKPAGALPNLVVALRGQVTFNLVGTIKIPDSGVLGTRFTTVPDVPIKRFVLRLNGGRRASLGAVANLCTPKARRQVAKLEFRGQNGKLVEVNQRLKVHGCGKRAHR